MQVLVSECLHSAVLDSGCSSTVAGKEWLQSYIDSLSPTDKKSIQSESSDKFFRFGGGTCLKSKGLYDVPCVLAGECCRLGVDVVECELPLLLSKDSMKKAEVVLDLVDDRASIFGKTVDLQCTSSGHYSLPINKTEIPIQPNFHVLFSDQADSEKTKTVEKLHKQFGHPSIHRLKSLFRDAGIEDKVILDLVDEVSKSCEVCKRFTKTPARPVVSLPMATEFNEAVAMDLKVWRPNLYFLHLIDIATRFSLAAVIRRKTPDLIIHHVMTLWIGSGFGCPKKFLADNGGEFANEEYKDMCSNLNIEVLNTAANSPWQNGLCERNHAVVDDCVSKMLEDSPETPLEVALVWAINAKNALQMVYGYSPYQLVFGVNPNLPSVLVDKPPALEGTTISKMFASHLNTLHSARRAFMQAESSERIRRALRHQIRSLGDKFQTGEKVYFKKDDSKKWKGPGKVIGQDGKIVFVRHGSTYIRVPAYRLMRVGDEFKQLRRVISTRR